MIDPISIVILTGVLKNTDTNSTVILVAQDEDVVRTHPTEDYI